MTWTYSGDPGTHAVAAVRYLVQDTDMTEQLAQDEEILWQLGQNPNVRLAAAEVAQQIALKFARQATVRRGDTAVEYGKRAEQYAAMAVRLKREASIRGGKPYAGGIAAADKQTQEQDTDRVAPAFTRRMHDEALTGPEDT
jgi:hypothetical protein